MEGWRRRVLLLVQRPEAWVNIATVWSALRAHSILDAHVLVLPYNVEDQTTSARMAARTRTLLGSRGVPFEEWREGDRPELGRFGAVVINHPYDRERPANFHFGRLRAAIPISTYLPYGLSMGGGKKNLRLQFAQPTQVGATAVAVRSAWERRMYASHCPAGDSHVHVIGNPRFDALLADLASPVRSGLSRAIGERFAIVWNSHFSFAPLYSQSSNFSTFDVIGPELFRYARRNRSWLALIWRPHPGLFPVVLREGLLSGNELELLGAELDSAGIILDQAPSHVEAFAASDALITDVGSFLLEYLVTGKPLLALINPEGEPLNEESAALVEHYSRASTPDDVFKFIEDLADGATVPDLTTVRADHLPGLDGHAGERVAYLVEDLVTGRDIDSDERLKVRASPRLPERVSQRARSRKPARPTLPSTDIPPTPILDHLISGLEQLRARKAAEPVWRRRLRRAQNAGRTLLAEAIKQSPALMRTAGRMRTFHRRTPH